MKRGQWEQLFRVLLMSAASCGGRVDNLDASPSDGSTDEDGTIVSPPPDADAAPLSPIDISDCSIGPNQCAWLYDLSCVLAKFGIADGGTLSEEDLKRIVNAQMQKPCVVENGKLRCGFYCPGGRPPSRAVLRGVAHDPTTLAGFFAESATQEAASVLGFQELARTLASFRAPQRFRRWARRSAREERRHERRMNAEARKRGLVPRHVRSLRPARRSLEAFARDNLVEGCIVEAYSALLLLWLGEHSPPAFRQMFRSIARDEIAHAALAFEIHAWARSRLDVLERRAIQEAMVETFRSLGEAAAIAPSAELAALGVPPPNIASKLVEHLAAVHLALFPLERFERESGPSRVGYE